MKKVIVIGCPGSGKSTFSKRLAHKTALPLFHLDLLYWNADRSSVSKEVFLQRLDQVLEQERWIIDGNYESTLEMRIKACDTVFFLDHPLKLCLQGIQERKGKVRDDLPWVEAPDEVDEEFMDLIRSYGHKNRPVVLRLLEQYSDRTIFVFRDRAESEKFLMQL